MEVHLTPEQEAELSELATRKGATLMRWRRKFWVSI
jgi:hypothetical protein